MALPRDFDMDDMSDISDIDESLMVVQYGKYTQWSHVEYLQLQQKKEDFIKRYMLAESKIALQMEKNRKLKIEINTIGQRMRLLRKLKSSTDKIDEILLKQKQIKYKKCYKQICGPAPPKDMDSGPSHRKKSHTRYIVEEPVKYKNDDIAEDSLTLPKDMGAGPSHRKKSPSKYIINESAEYNKDDSVEDSLTPPQDIDAGPSHKR